MFSVTEPRNNKSGDTYSHSFGTTIGSERLTTVFPVGTGVVFRKSLAESSAAAGIDRGTLFLSAWAVRRDALLDKPAVAPGALRTSATRLLK